MNNQQIAQDSLTRAVANRSTANYAAIFEGFAAMGINDIRPRENVFTYHAWRAKGRQVRKGQHGVKIVTFVEMSKKTEAEESETFRAARTTTVFHVTQTDEVAK